jgi:hypothetical protein
LKVPALIIVLILGFHSLAAQENADSTAREKARQKNIYSRARKASVMSAVVPGLGQAYNRKYWKIPIIYGALGGFGYLFSVRQQEYDYYRTNLAAMFDEDPGTENITPYNANGLKELKQSARNGRDFAVLGFVMVYLLQIVDANVDAHLRTFDVSDNLSLRVQPWIAPGTMHGGGISLTMQIGKK